MGNIKLGPRTKVIKTFSIRLHPGEDLKKQILIICNENKISAGVILSSVGSLISANLRMADSSTVKPQIKNLNGPFEILSLNGTLSLDGLHLHLSISNSDGHCFGGHLLEGCLIHTTCELVIGQLQDVQFIRELDTATKYKELKIK